jgi:hypothetical protein
MEGSYHLVGASLVKLAILAGQLDSGFVGLGPAVAKEGPIQAAILREKLGQLDLRDSVELIRALDELLGLLG